MRKRIALFGGQVQREGYYPELIDELSKQAHSLDMDLFVLVNYGIFDHNIILYGEGEKTIFKIPDFDTFEGIIVDESVLHLEGMADELYEYLRQNAKCPVVYIKSVREAFKSVLFSDKQAMKDITNHFIHDHGFTHICHMAGRWDLQDAHERADGYREAMEEAGLTVTDDMIFYGDYWKNKGREAADQFLGKGEMPQAIVCANDFMAIALSRELNSRGIRIPDDICISGYDNAVEGQDFVVPITTFEADGRLMAREAFSIIQKQLKHEDVPSISYVRNRMILRNSCGCNMCSEGTNLIRKINLLEEKHYGSHYIYFMISGFDISFDETDIFTRADFYFKYTKAQKGYICLTDDAFDSMSRPVDRISEYSDKMILKRVYYSDPDKRYRGPNDKFERREMLPEYILKENGPETYMIVTIHSNNKVYGYLALTYSKDDFPTSFVQSYAGALGSVLDNVNMRKIYMSVEEMRRVYLKDELTGIYNRRGFEQHLSVLSDRAKQHDQYLSVVSLDMDGLKYINDKYGHAEGDSALSEFASVLLSVLEGEEICARYGGDEFAAILISDDKDRHLKFSENLEKALVQANELLKKPYSLHASCGAVCVNDHPGESLRSCITMADKIMYENKRVYKARLGEAPR